MKGYIDEENLEPIIEDVFILDKDGVQKHLVDAVLDTGFNGEFCMPHKLLHLTNFELVSLDEYELGDGRIIKEKIYQTEIIIDGQHQKVETVLTQSDQALIGTKLLDHKILTLDFKKYKVVVEE